MVMGSGKPILYSPYEQEREKWKPGVQKATCHHFPNHVPPQVFRRCGVFVVEIVLDAVVRAHHCDWGVPAADPMFYAPNPPSAVFGRVNLKSVVRGGHPR
jgi:hypothetical protein